MCHSRGMIDLDAERTRLSAQLTEAEAEVRRLRGEAGERPVPFEGAG